MTIGSAFRFNGTIGTIVSGTCSEKGGERMTISIIRVTPEKSREVAVLAQQLLEEIMDTIQDRVFDFDLDDAATRLQEFIASDKYHAFAAVDTRHPAQLIGFVSLYESLSIYAGGAFGTIPELYVCPAYRKQQIGRALLDAAKAFAAQRGWKRLEVTTPPIPQFQKTLAFYEREGFSTSGGRKLQFGVRRPSDA